MSKLIKEKFDDISQNYDRQRKQLIACLDDFYNTPLSFIDSAAKKINVFDIGGGTGLFSLYLLKKYPFAEITLIDLSEKMLDIAKQRFKGNENIKFLLADYTSYQYEESYDVIISALSIHHLSNEQKRELYKKSFEILRPKGVFINADQVAGKTKYIEDVNKKAWKQYIESSGLSRDEIDSAYERIKLDKEAKMDEQLKWLEDVGFIDLECVYKYYHFAAMVGRKA